MTVVNLTERKETDAFALKAAEYFKAHATAYTYADGDPEPGALFGIRWNPYTVCIVKLAEEFVPALYPTHPLIGSDLPRFEATPTT